MFCAVSQGAIHYNVSQLSLLKTLMSQEVSISLTQSDWLHLHL